MPDAPAAADVPDDPAARPATLYAQAEHATPEALQRAYRLVVGSAIGFWERNLRTGEMWYSPDFYRTLGLTPGGERDQINALLHPQDRPVFESAYASAIRDIGPFTYEVRYRATSGEYRWARASGRVWPGADGQAERLIGTISDVHAEKCAMLELEALARRFERAMDASSEAHFEQTVGRDDFYMHPRLSELLGHPPGTPAPTLAMFWSWLHPDDVPPVRAMFELRSTTPGSWEIDYRLRQHDGSYRYIRSRGRSERAADGTMRLTGMLDDVQKQTLARQELETHRHGLEALVVERTARLEAALAEARRQREQAEQANEAKSSFLAHMSHEIRTPLNGVIGMAELALRESGNDQQRRHLKLALQSGRALMSILNDVLDFSRIAAGGLPRRDEPFDVAEVLAESLRSIMPAVRDRGLGVMYDMFGTITRVRGDWQRLQQIATNLLANAAKFTERGHIELVITTEATGPGQCRASIVFRDTGPGMTPEVARRVFEPFVQGDDSLARRHGGTGLGLSIALGLARSMDGDLTLHTAPGAGSTFVLTRPLQVQPGEQPAARHPRPGVAWLVYTRSVPAQWLAHRLDCMGWRSEIVAGVPGLVRRATMTAPGSAMPDLVVLAEAALDASVPLLELRGLLPTAHIVLLVRPDWNQPQLESAARAGNIPLQFMPITPQALIEMLDTRGPSPARAESGFMDLPFLPDLGLDVLVAEDNPVNQIIVSEMIDSLGLKTRLSGDGAQVIEACCQRPPALVLMDLQMPGMDGLEATRALRRLQRQGQLPPFPIVALTAHATPQDRDDCMEAGMVGFLTKPVALGALRSELARWLQI